MTSDSAVASITGVSWITSGAVAAGVSCFAGACAAGVLAVVLGGSVARRACTPGRGKRRGSSDRALPARARLIIATVMTTNRRIGPTSQEFIPVELTHPLRFLIGR